MNDFPAQLALYHSAMRKVVHEAQDGEGDEEGEESGEVGVHVGFRFSVITYNPISIKTVRRRGGRLEQNFA